MSVDGNSFASGLEAVRAQITGAIRQAASATGASFEYLLSAAKMESNLNPSASASTSSARGLYQFIEQTWLGTVKEAGPSLGYGQYADAISKSASGFYSIADPGVRQQILALRDDPVVSSAMAGVLTQANSFKLTDMIGRRPSDGELYIAHFMGVGGAAKLITSAADNPRASAAALFPSAAAANQPIFYDRSGAPRSVGEVYSLLTSRYEAAAQSQSTRTAIASLGASPAAGQGAGNPSQAGVADNAFFLSGFPQAQQASSGRTAEQPSQATAYAPTFRSLFQVGERNEPVSPAVRALWGNAPSAQNGQAAAQPLDLFSDRAGTFSG